MFEDRCEDSTLNGQCKQVAFRNPISNTFPMPRSCYYHKKKTTGLIHTIPDLVLVWDDEE